MEAIVDVDASSKYYLVRWAGTDKTGKPWELEWRHKHHLRRCGQLLQEFKEEREAAGYLVARAFCFGSGNTGEGLTALQEMGR